MRTKAVEFEDLVQARAAAIGKDVFDALHNGIVDGLIRSCCVRMDFTDEETSLYDLRPEIELWVESKFFGESTWGLEAKHTIKLMHKGRPVWVKAEKTAVLNSMRLLDMIHLSCKHNNHDLTEFV